MAGLWIVFFLVIGSLIFAKVHGSYKLGQAFWYVVMGLLLASVFPNMPKAAHDFVVAVYNSIANSSVFK